MTDDAIAKKIPCQGSPEQQLALITTWAEASSKTKAKPGSPLPHVLLCSGFHSNMRGTKCIALAEHAAEIGYNFTRFDYRGHGESDGEAINCTLTDWLADTETVIDSLEGPVLLIGSSMGAWLATHAALRRPDRIVGLLLIAAAPDFVTELIEPALDHQQRWQLETGEAVFLPSDYDEPSRPVTQDLINSGRELALLQNPDSVSSIKVPVRLIHGTGDIDVPWQMAERLMQGFGGEARLNLLHRADHRLSDDLSLSIIKRELLDLIEETA